MSAIKSMTGYASTSIESAAGLLEISIKAVNGRFCDVSMASNFDLGASELNCVKLVKESVKRGSVNVNIKLVHNKNSSFTLNKQNLHELIDALQQIATEVKEHQACTSITTSGNLDLLSLATMPGILSSAHQSGSESIEIAQEIRADFDNSLSAGLSKAIEAFDQHRMAEGERLKEILLEKITLVSERLDVVKNNLDHLVDQERQRIKDKIEKLDIELDPERLENEVALQAQRADIAEEHDRLRSHLQSLLQILNGDGNQEVYTPAGKRLDFMMQELVRESNTIASKASNLELTQTAVELKVIIEQMREQIQNIE